MYPEVRLLNHLLHIFKRACGSTGEALSHKQIVISFVPVKGEFHQFVLNTDVKEAHAGNSFFSSAETTV